MRRIAFVTLTLGLTLRPGALGAQGGFHWSGRLAPGKRLEIQGVNGDIRASAAAGDEVEVSARKHAPRGDTAAVEIQVVPFEDGVAICAVYPTPVRAAEPNSCTPGRRHSNTENNDVVVDFTVRIPAGVTLSAATVNGLVDAEGVDGSVHARTVNGGIQIATARYADATTVNGSITAALGRGDWSDALAFRTVNGSIALTLPATLSTDVRTETVNGDITSAFPLLVSGHIGPRRVRGTIGTGGRALDVRTVNGGITLNKGP